MPEKKDEQVSAQEVRRSRPQLDRSWGKAVIACAATFFSSAVHSTSGIFYVALMREFGVNRETASWPTSVFQAIDNVSGFFRDQQGSYDNFYYSLSGLHFLMVVDATAKYPTGFLQASLAEIGAYDECIETVVHDDHGVEVVRGQFCNVHVLVGDDLSFVDNVIPAFRFSHKRAGSFKGYLADKKLTGLRMGVCFINSCTEQDITNIGRTLFGTAADIVVKNCVTGVDDGIDITQACIM
ncbi:uncharacterized protein LOC125756881 [Rhipicephalus sanguineus]|uniref:uncharacterized protein LOC125756881 n=1 Tax=Rhipicephalus sanguineus TaxID=34632 RepID=UPI0020C2BD0A|nr:uncharacterized protein LOC125756881 [Rhipicephalus sanguineus]